MLEAEVAVVALEEEVELTIDAETEGDALTGREVDVVTGGRNVVLTGGKGEGLEQHLLGLVEVGEGGVVHRSSQLGIGVGRDDDDALGEDLNGQVEGSLAFGQDIEDGLVEALLEIGARGYLVEGSDVELRG